MPIREGRWDCPSCGSTGILGRQYRTGQRLALRPDRFGLEPRILPADSLTACRRRHAGRGEPPADSLGCSARAA